MRSQYSLVSDYILVGSLGVRTPSRGSLGLTRPSLQWLLVSVLGIKQPERNDDHWPPPSAEDKNEWNYISTLHTPPWRGQGQLNVQRFCADAKWIFLAEVGCIQQCSTLGYCAYRVVVAQTEMYNFSDFINPSWRDNSVSIVIRYRLDGPQIESRWGEIFRARPDGPWGPASLLYNVYRVFPGGIAAGGGAVTTHPHLERRLNKE
jgi:hypothetical protein